ncbi:MAG: hypothetical protein EA374_02655 [Acholeplasmatales bacterium]|nr:MAG: hypothetical protein EA374_02655 [Acholeplasmatales bacterium]
MFKRVLTQLRRDFALSHHLRALPFGLALGFLAVAPFVMLCINLLLLYIRVVYLYLFIINGLVMVAVLLGVYVYGATLKNYRPQSRLRPFEVSLSLGAVFAGILFIIGTVLILVITPTFI